MNGWAQEDYLSVPAKPISLECPKGYIGLSTGINNNNGLLGFNLEYNIAENLSLSGGMGLSTWGQKASLEGKYFFKNCYRGTAIGLGVTRSSGLRSIVFQDDAVPPNMGKVNIELELLPQLNIALFGYTYFKVGRKNRFHFLYGYSVPTSEKTFKVLSSESPSKSLKSVIQLMAPGGLMLGLGFSFGV